MDKDNIKFKKFTTKSTNQIKIKTKLKDIYQYLFFINKLIDILFFAVII